MAGAGTEATMDTRRRILGTSLVIALIGTPAAAGIDGDGVWDGGDNCVAVYNPGQEDGDGDGIGDTCDLCPLMGVPTGAENLLSSGQNVIEARSTADGQHVVFIGWTGGFEELYSVPVAGGAPTLLSGGLAVQGFALGNAGSTVIFVGDTTPFGETAPSTSDLFVVPAAGGTPVNLTDNVVGDDVLALRLSPDEMTAVYRTRIGGGISLRSLPVSGGTPTILLPNSVRNDFVITPDGAMVVFRSAYAGGNIELHTVPIGGGVVTPLTPGSAEVLEFALTSDLTHAVYQVSSSYNSIYSAPLSGGGGVLLNEGPLLPGTVSAYETTPDGSRVIFLADYELIGTVVRLYSVPVGGGTVVQLSVDGSGWDAVVNNWAASHDGNWVAYASNHENSGERELFIVPASGGTSVQLSPALPSGGDVEASSDRLLFTPDDQYVIYDAELASPTRSAAYAVPVAGGPSIELSPTLEFAEWGTWLNGGFAVSSDSSTLLYAIDPGSGYPEVFVSSIPGGATTSLGTVDYDTFRGFVPGSSLDVVWIGPGYVNDLHSVLLASDDDGDGQTICGGDCDDAAPSVFALAPPVCSDGLNNDCSDPAWPVVTDETDDDGDGFAECDGDCDDDEASVMPGGAPICDGLNNDCDDPAWPALTGNEADADGDGYTGCTGDCDDQDTDTYPSAPGICDGLNNDCNDPSWPLDAAEDRDDDGDGFTECMGDCVDAEATIYPGSGVPCPSGWSRTLQRLGFTVVNDVQPTTDGGFIVVGHDELADFVRQAWIAKLDADGALEWQHDFEDPEGSFLNSVVENPGGSFTAVGTVYEPNWSPYFWQIVLGATGATVSEQTAESDLTVGLAMRRMSDGGTARLVEYGGVIRRDVDGSVVWHVETSGSGANALKPSGWDLTETTDGGIATVGGLFDEFGSEPEPYVFKYDSAGVLQWSLTVDTVGDDASLGVAATNDGGVIVASLIETPPDDTATLLTRFDAAGQVVWQRLYDDAGFQRFQEIIPTTDGGFVAAGFSPGPTGNDWQLAMFKVDGSGTVLWERLYGPGTLGNQQGMALVEMGNGDLLVAGSRSRGTDQLDGWLLRVDAEGLAATCGVQNSDMTVTADSRSWQPWGVTQSPTLTLVPSSTPSRTVTMTVDSPCDCSDADADGFDSCFECDDTLASVHPGAPEINDGLDNQCPGDPGSGQTDEIEGLLEVADQQVCWEAQPGATGYEVLVSSTADFSSGCALSFSDSTCWDDPVTPGPGETTYYLVRSAAPFTGDWGCDSTESPRVPACLP